MKSDKSEALKNEISELQANLQRERAISAELRVQVKRLSEEIALHKSVRAEYSRALSIFIPPGAPFTQEEIDDHLVNGVGSEEIFRMLDELAAEKPIILPRSR